MGKVIVDEEVLNGIGSEIIAKGGAVAPMKPSEMPAAIQAIPSGSSYPKPWKNDGDMYVWVSSETDAFRLRFDFAVTNKNSAIVIDWGDGTSNTIAARSSEFYQIRYTHNYANKGEYVIHVSGYDAIKTRSRSFSSNSGSGTASMLDSASHVMQIETGDTRFVQIGGAGHNGFVLCFNLVALKTYADIMDYGLNGCRNLKKIDGEPSIYGSTNSLSGCSNLEGSVVCVGDTIMGGAFDSCYLLGGVAVNSSVTSIGSSAFLSCSKLSSDMEIGDDCTSIGVSAFACSGIKKFSIGSGVTSIGNNAFDACEYLSEFVITASTPPTLGTNVFRATHSQFKIIVPFSADHSILNAYKTATNWSAYASKMIEAEEA